MAFCLCASPRYSHCCLLCYPANSLLSACLPPCPHLLASIIRKAGVWGNPLSLPGQAPSAKAAQPLFLQTPPVTPGNRPSRLPSLPLVSLSIGSLLDPGPPPGNPSLGCALPGQSKTGGLSFNGKLPIRTLYKESRFLM